MNWLLVVAILIIAACVIAGIRKGALRMAYRMLSWVFVIVFMLAMTPHIDTFLTEKTGLDQWIQDQTRTFAEDRWEHMRSEIMQQPEEAAVSESGAEELLGGIDIRIPAALSDAYDDAAQKVKALSQDTSTSIQTAAKEAQEAVISQASRTLTDYVMRGIAAIVAFILAKLIVWIVGLFVKAADRNAFVGGISRALGAVLGLGIGLLYVWIILYIIGCFCWTGWGGTLTSYVRGSAFLTWIDSHNLVKALLSR